MRGRLSAGLVAAMLLLALTATPVSAEAPDAQGWWWSAKTETVATVYDVPPPPWVPGDGLYIASNASGAEAVSALRFRLPDAATVGTLSLRVAESQGTPVVGLCRVTGDWEPRQGGAWSQRPDYDCEAAPTGVMDAGEESLTFSAAALAGAGVLNVALVPGRDQSGANPTFQLALQKPEDGSLGVVQGTSTTGAPRQTPVPAPAPSQPAGAAVAEPAPAQTFVPAADPPTSTPQAVQTAPGSGQTQFAGSQQQFGQPVVSPQPVQGGDNRTQVVAFIGIIVLAVIYLRLAETEGRAPRSLVAFGRRAQGAGEPGTTPKPAGSLPAADPTPGKRIGGLRSARGDEE